LEVEGGVYELSYQPAESHSGMFGGNSNWRGPIWMPMNYILVDALNRYDSHYGDALKVEYPTGSGNMATLGEVADQISGRLIGIFERDGDGRRPLYGGTEKFQSDPAWRDNVLFYEYFHGDNGAGVGAAHQTGWTGLVLVLIEEQERRRASAEAKPAVPSRAKRRTTKKTEDTPPPTSGES
jgi:glycogen debranching enzyme